MAVNDKMERVILTLPRSRQILWNAVNIGDTTVDRGPSGGSDCRNEKGFAVRRPMMQLCALVLGCFTFIGSIAAAEKPNFIFVLADDMGYGDVKCNNPDGKIATPNIDRLAAEGMRFTDGHTSSSVCSPTRYSIITGRYNWRSRLQTTVLGGLSPHLIEPDRLTVARMLQEHGYTTACIGKWHLGMDWPRKPNTRSFGDNIEQGFEGWAVDYHQPITNGPNTVGFDYFFGISASLDMVPFTFIENDHVTAVPTEDKNFVIMPGKADNYTIMPGKSNRTHRGPAAPEFKTEDVLPMFTRKSVEFIARNAADARSGKPFFLYFPLNSPHGPFAPAQEWQGRSGINPYADFVMQSDDSLGQVLRALDEHKLAENTVVIFTSDNGCGPYADYPTLLAHGHHANSFLRGGKADIWDGGHRVPLVVRWPGHVRPGSTSDQLVCLVDFMATAAEIIGVKLPDHAAEDSVSLLPILLGKATKPVREALVHHSATGKFSIREGHWKLALCPGSGGWSQPQDPQAAKQGLPPVQLYDLSADPSEQHNVQAEHPKMVQQMITLLEKYVANGRSTPGSPQKNDVPVDIWKTKAP